MPIKFVEQVKLLVPAVEAQGSEVKEVRGWLQMMSGDFRHFGFFSEKAGLGKFGAEEGCEFRP